MDLFAGTLICLTGVTNLSNSKAEFSTADISIFTAWFTADVTPSEIHRIGHDVASHEGNGEGEDRGELHFVVLVKSSSCAIEA
ncbi:uncharacterized protein EURHEDRAFT_413652 [Aspergillus ruber CBS 135680]|uniref:Uncharacterized protein n=1 Tax=Aspergillus ruber (strain CBS 135680) TaxID=1388766 RepID=A0A017SAW5_ASPRC|nr:uncharacterized protein EURHEDRAFT_413652 [Aspergillus ruber CBS 135680]EYE94042.1 hypothetical protein EURHEDRAFT_413652 [Aspergillus ruber CBS 135680]